MTRARANAINFVFNFQFVLVLLPQQEKPIEAAAEVQDLAGRLPAANVAAASH